MDKLCEEHEDRLEMIGTMGVNGHAPEIRGAHLFDVGNEDTVERIRKSYFDRGFKRGRSETKFIVGDFGLGKTHLMRLLLGAALESDCVVAEISLNKDLDFTNNMSKYREITRELVIPGYPGTGISALIEAAYDRLLSRIPDHYCPEEAESVKIKMIEVFAGKFQLPEYGRVIKFTMGCLGDRDMAGFSTGIRWLEGAFRDRAVCSELEVSPITQSEENTVALRATHSLFQFIRHTRYRGTVIGYDESEQSLTPQNPRKRQNIASLLQVEVNSAIDLKEGSALILFAVTPDVTDTFLNFPALQQRLTDAQSGFFDGNTRSPQINLAEQARELESGDFLRNIGIKIVDVMFRKFDNPNCDLCDSEYTLSIDELTKRLGEIAEQIGQGFGGGERRAYVRRACRLVEAAVEEDSIESFDENDDEVDEELF